MELIFWGSRGSVPCFSKQKVHFGTNTSSIEIRIPGEEPILFDAGTGIVSLGVQMERQGLPEHETIHLFFSHYHWDHIQGLPFFRPLYRNGITAILYGNSDIEKAFSNQMTAPYFPLPFDMLPATIKHRAIDSGESVRLRKAVITPFDLHHPQGCYGYVVESEGRRFVYATDTEPDGGKYDELLIQKAFRADVLAMDANNSLEESKQRKGWGHSSWKEAAHVARAAQVKRLVLLHHDPFHDDQQVQDKQQLAQNVFPDSICAYEGLRIRIESP